MPSTKHTQSCPQSALGTGRRLRLRQHARRVCARTLVCLSVCVCVSGWVGRTVWQSGGRGSRQWAFHFLPLFKELCRATWGRATGRMSNVRQNVTNTNEAAAYLDAEVTSVHVVTQEQVPGGAGGAAHLEQLHQVEELSVDVSTHWTHKRNIQGYSSHFLTFGLWWGSVAAGSIRLGSRFTAPTVIWTPKQ